MPPARLLTVLASLLVVSCSRSSAPPPPEQVAAPAPLGLARQNLETVLLEGIPHVRQKPDFCGEACVSMALARLGRPLDQDEIFARTGLDPALGRGAYTAELKQAVEAVGFDPGPVWIRIDAAKADEALGAELAALHADLQKGIPSIVCMHYDETPTTTEHFRLVVGYDSSRDEIIYHEPAEDAGAYRRMSRSRFLSLWPLKYNKDAWTAIRLRLAPRDLELAKATPRKPGFSPADYAQKVMEVKQKTSRLRGTFTVFVEPPFVVVGDGAAPQVRRGAEGTVRWATEKLKKDYFAKDPSRILVVWLFKDAPSYERNAITLFGEKPTTPYGYYTSKHGALVMNIATGGGTLVHEIVHPFIEANFPDCPPWFNEGLGSLYEQSGEVDGRIYGYTNWRLRGLQSAIAENRVPSIRALTAMNDSAFYEGDYGVHYAASRYLLHYLQEKGLLVRYYHAFHANREKDPTGYDTLRRVLGEEDMAAFKKRWETYVLGLSFP
ncbi:C39 family peptidase [Polyangium jinanense]|uniref:C39 family peptidase n=1 Tax=Polyangium jinanense TaxID=2829994 RepID=A0A9X3XFU6_9BACT|nr:C39 family peptidase [Polyangium jinanense]MDC3958410.1 C39 family peptidase [Polyangium jinanense]MDC3987963.1 C39 family peptidase [Polyangium jinanense]